MSTLDIQQISSASEAQSTYNNVLSSFVSYTVKALAAKKYVKKNKKFLKV